MMAGGNWFRQHRKLRLYCCSAISMLLNLTLVLRLLIYTTMDTLLGNPGERHHARRSRMPPHRDECPTTVGQFTYFLQQREIRGTPVLDADDNLAGMVSVSDIFKAVNEGKNC